ncbi:hypothetical protein D3W54_15005 [Komagataeibacter medellinensis]|uniref:Uncharacterized protein n=2 Tax=Komagataeibacter medellinensis TaxID=1177712 RepID=A0ABQ6VRM0_9PROT|nr:hypothetical protein D3W54_15005 [Komagataeibacter medellinensis]
MVIMAKVGSMAEQLHEYEGRPDDTPVSYTMHGGGVYRTDQLVHMNMDEAGAGNAACGKIAARALNGEGAAGSHDHECRHMPGAGGDGAVTVQTARMPVRLLSGCTQSNR